LVAPEEPIRLKRSLGLLEATMIGMGATIGPTIFVVPSFAFSLAGPAVIVSFIIAGLVTLLTAINYAYMASIIPEAGGGYSFASHAFGGFPAFLSGWLMWIGNVAYASLSAYTFGLSLAHVFPQLSVIGVSFMMILLFSLINFIGAKESGRSEVILSGVVLAVLAAFVIAGIPHIQVSRYNPLFPHGLSPVFFLTGYVYSIYIGFEIIANTTEEVKMGSVIVPKAIILTILISIVLFPLIVTILVGLSPGSLIANSETPLVDSTVSVFGSRAGTIMAIAGMLASLAALNAAMIASARTIFALARDTRIPRFFFRLHRSFRTPYYGIAASLVTAAIFLIPQDVDFMVYATNFGYLLGLSIINASGLVLRKRGSRRRSILIPLGAFVTSLVVLPTLHPNALIIGGTLTVIGALANVLYNRRKRTTSASERTP